MPGRRLVRLLSLLSEGGNEPTPARLCEVAVKAIGVTGAGVMIMSGDVPRGYACSSNEVATLIEDLQFTLGEGPCVDAYELDGPVLEPDLADPSMDRWPAFTPTVVESGARAVFGFPLHAGGVRLGALNLYNDTPGPLDDEQHADALVMADIAARGVLTMQAGAPPDLLSEMLEDQADFRVVVHQAAGMVAVQLATTVADALVRLRAYAFSNSTTLDDIARQVTSRRLRFDGSSGT